MSKIKKKNSRQSHFSNFALYTLKTTGTPPSDKLAMRE